MLKMILQIVGFYFVLIGTWRLANATTHNPSLPEAFEYKKTEENYNPLRDLISLSHILAWIYRTIISFKHSGWFGGAIILHKQFNWGLLWLLLGVILQFIAGLMG
jgi:hypothetical protein